MDKMPPTKATNTEAKNPLSRSGYESIGADQLTYGTMDEARMAYVQRDKKLSKLVHEQKAIEGHRTNGDFIKSIVYGGLDGILTMFAIISGAAGGSLSIEAVIVLGVSNLLADAVSMGIGDTVSTFAYHEHVQQERNRECWEFDNYPEGEIEEMVDLYESRGLPRHKAQIVVETMAKYREFFIDVMMNEELKLKVPDEDDNPFKDGLVTFASFMFFGGMPLIAYLMVPLLDHSVTDQTLFSVACGVTMIVLFALGASKSMFSSKSWLYSGCEFLLLGTAAAILSYGVGYFVAYLGEDVFKEKL